MIVDGGVLIAYGGSKGYKVARIETLNQAKKNNMKTKLSIKQAILITSLMTAALGAQAQTFSYTEGRGTVSDVLVGFRNATNATSKNYSVIVDAGSISTLTGLSTGQSVTVYNGTNLATYLNTAGIGWSVLAGNRSGLVYVTRPRASYYTQTPAWPVNSTPGNFAVEVDNIGDNAVNIAYGANPNNATSPFNTGNVVVEPFYGDAQQAPYFNSYAYVMSDSGVSGNPDGRFWGGSIEQVSSGATATRSDFYAITSSSSTHLGYFEWSTNSVLTYTAGPSAAPAPQLSIANNHDGSFSISFPSVSGINYALISTNLGGLTAPLSTWPATGDVVAGDGTIKSFINFPAGDATVYSVKLQ